jgi:hypothetical protein
MYIDYDPTDDNAMTPMDAMASMAGAVTQQLYFQINCPFRPENTVLPQHKYSAQEVVPPIN